MDESKKQILSDIFWEMNSISSRSESHSETEITETDDGNGNIVQTETTVTKIMLYITVSHLTVDEMADLYGFDAEQREYLAELLKDKKIPFGRQSFTASVIARIRSLPSLFLRWAMWAASRIGLGMASEAVWNGVLVL